MSTTIILRPRHLLGVMGIWACVFAVMPFPSFAQTPGDIDRALRIDQADQNLGQLNPATNPLDWITGLEVRPEGITEVDEPPLKKKKTPKR